MKLDIVCNKHPRYKAQRPPTSKYSDVGCDACWILHLLKYGFLTGVAQIGTTTQPKPDMLRLARGKEKPR